MLDVAKEVRTNLRKLMKGLYVLAHLAYSDYTSSYEDLLKNQKNP